MLAHKKHLKAKNYILAQISKRTNMNRLSELQTIVKVSKICNNNGLTKEADQLLNIFTKLAQENPDLQNKTEGMDDPQEAPTVTQPISQPAEPENLPEENTDIINDINDYNLSAEILVQNLNTITDPKAVKQLLPELNRVIDLIRTILNYPELDESNKKTLSQDLPLYLDIQEALKQ
jgi:hypothetical protein